MITHPLIEGFRLGIAHNLEEELAAMEQADLTSGQSNQAVPMQPTRQQLAAAYGCSTKTIRRMAAKGVDVTDPAAVGIQLAGQKVISMPMLEAVSKLIP